MRTSFLELTSLDAESLGMLAQHFMKSIRDALAPRFFRGPVAEMSRFDTSFGGVVEPRETVVMTRLIGSFSVSLRRRYRDVVVDIVAPFAKKSACVQLYPQSQRIRSVA